MMTQTRPTELHQRRILMARRPAAAAEARGQVRAIIRAWELPVDPDIAVHATCVRVPVFIGHGEAVTLEFERPITEAEARAALKEAPGLVVVDHRKDPTVANGLSLWVVADNLRKGAALNAVQIAEVLARDHLAGGKTAKKTPQKAL